MNGWTLDIGPYYGKETATSFPASLSNNYVMRPPPSHCTQRKITLCSSTSFLPKNRRESRQLLHEMCHMQFVWATAPSYHFSSQRNQYINTKHQSDAIPSRRACYIQCKDIHSLELLPARGWEQGGFQHVGFAAGQSGWQKAEDAEDADAG